MFNMGDNDEFIFVIKNYNYIDSPYVFMQRFKAENIDENGEVLFKIPPEVSKHIKPGAFYNFALLLNAFDSTQETEYRKLTDNGAVRLEYGAQDLTIEPDYDIELGFSSAIIGIRLELLDEISSVVPDHSNCEVLGVRLELLDALSSIDPSKFMCKVEGVRLEVTDEVSSVPPAISEILDMRIEAIEED
jgi:hypothetical protein